MKTQFYFISIAYCLILAFHPIVWQGCRQTKMDMTPKGRELSFCEMMALDINPLPIWNLKLDTLQHPAAVLRFILAVRDTSFQEHYEYNGELPYSRHAMQRIDTLGKIIEVPDPELQRRLDLLRGWSDLLGARPLVKADFDSNGRMDILLFFRYFGAPRYWVVLDSGDLKFVVKDITRINFLEDTNFEVARIVWINNRPAICQTWLEGEFGSDTTLLLSDTLVFRFGSFIEYKVPSKQHSIESVHFSTTLCFGFCPEFQMRLLSPDSLSEYQAIHYCKQEGSFLGRLSSKQWKNICDLVNYLGMAEPPPLKEGEWRIIKISQISHPHEPQQNLAITFDGGKKFSCNGAEMDDSPGWSRLREFIYSLRDDVNWQPK